MNRGIITNATRIEVGSNTLSITSDIESESIRFYVLYWDKIVIPTNPLLHQAIPDEEILITSEIVSRPMIQPSGSFSESELGGEFLKAQCEIARRLMQDKTTDWVIHQQGQEILLPDDVARDNNVLRVALNAALPAPSQSIPLNEILEFKEKRKDQLVTLHESLDEVYLEILKSPDPSLSSKKAFSRLSKEVEGLNKVSKESFGVTKKYDLTAEININGKDIFLASAGGAVVDFFLSGMTVPLATPLAAVGSMIKISSKSTKTLTYADKNKKLSYLSSASKEGVLTTQ